ncbi:MAG: ribonuclease E inhibitor RraB [Lentisphaerae bacterium]|nr:ribonuclease E inhibitor RraB [Lentisphaerota bacterium]
MNKDKQAINPHSGQFILEQLRRFGSDLNRKHVVSFWLYFLSEDLAQQAARRAESAGLKSEVSPPLKDSPDSKWLCLLYCPHVPDESLLDGISGFCAKLASEFNGEFDGWESSLELEEGQPGARE